MKTMRQKREETQSTVTEMLRLLPGEVGRNTVGDRNPRGVPGKRRWEVHIPVGKQG